MPHELRHGAHETCVTISLKRPAARPALPFSLTLLFATMWNCHAQPDARRKILHKFAKNSGSKHGFRCAIPGCPNRGVTQQCCKQRLCVACLAHTHHVQALCSFCDLPVADIDEASGYTGKGSDPIIFPRCPHALHAECLRTWQYGECTAEQRRLLDRRRAPRHAKLLRGTGLVSYDYHFRGACHGCAAGASRTHD